MISTTVSTVILSFAEPSANSTGPSPKNVTKANSIIKTALVKILTNMILSFNPYKNYVKILSLAY